MKKKLAVVRGPNVAPCPFGLKVIEACKDAGGAVSRMTPTDGLASKLLKEKTIKENKIIYMTQKEDKRCPYANEILNKFGKVDCSWGDTAAGEGVSKLPSSPLYPKVFVGEGTSPYGPNNVLQDVYDSRLFFQGPERGIDVPFGMYSVFADHYNRLALIKLAETTNKNSNIKDKLEVLRTKYFDIIKSIVPNKIAKLSQKELEQLLIVIDDWSK